MTRSYKGHFTRGDCNVMIPGRTFRLLDERWDLRKMLITKDLEPEQSSAKMKRDIEETDRD